MPTAREALIVIGGWTISISIFTFILFVVLPMTR
jgi:hypothetical protein